MERNRDPERPDRQVKLLQLLEVAVPEARLQGSQLETVEVAGIAFDSRQVSPGDLFVAYRGLRADGHDFLQAARQRGAVAVVVESQESLQALPADFPAAVVPNSRAALAKISAAFWDFPGRRLVVIGVTGTDGKTTTSALIRSILEAAGHGTGMVSTVSAAIGDESFDTGLHVTTPDAVTLQRHLAAMVEVGTDYAVVEATSHGLAQHRVTACEFDVAVVTNITHEHLDYHGSYEAYLEAKAELFRTLSTSFRKAGVDKVAVLNRDDGSFAHLIRIPADCHLSYGLHESAHIRAHGIESSSRGLKLQVVSSEASFPVQSPLLGDFNVHNILAAVAVGLSQGVDPQAIAQGVAAMDGIPGRMERIDLGQNFTAIVDFAHTPNALERALTAVRPLTSGQVAVVFGCAGLRDRAKRPLMGEIAGRLADRIVITAEDPRTEDLGQIMEEIAVGCRGAGRREGEDFFRIGDRAEAIAFAIDTARRDDLVMVTGKGHERSMCFGETELPWSDVQAVRDALARRIGSRRAGS